MPDYLWIGPGLAAAEQVLSTIDIDAYGVVGATLEFTISYDNAVAYAMGKHAHPDFPWLSRSSANIKREEANLARVTVVFKGVSPEYAQGTIKTYAIEGCVTTEPIETHPNFKNFAGTPGDAQNGARFDDEERFVGFSAGFISSDAPDDIRRDKAGVRSYLAPGLILTETIVKPYTSITGYSPSRASSMAGLGCIEDPPETPLLPTVHTTRNYLLVGVTIEDLGNGTREVRKWRLSGPRGWDEDIYRRSSINR